MEKSDLDLLETLCKIPACSGDERGLRDFLIDYVDSNKANWKVQPQLIYGDDFQDCLILIFGEPKTAIYAHMDSVGYTVGYDNNLIKIGGPKAKEGSILVGKDSQGEIEGKLNYSIEDEGEDNKVITTSIIFHREIDRGTNLSYKANFSIKDNLLSSPYLDNRLGVLNALKVAETLENGAIAFSAWEEVGGGSVGYLANYLYNNFSIRQSLVSDITWITNGVVHGKGVAISMRDSGIPRKSYTQKILSLAKESKVPFQIEVESAGGSDGNALQKSPLPIDWCFIGAAEDNVHQPNETVHLKDIESMIALYNYLMKKL